MGFSLKASWNYKCPKCRHGDIFVSPMDIKNPLNMPERCEKCGQRTEPELGFYYGAMMVSYGISAWLYLGLVLILVFYFKWTVNKAMVLLIFLAVITYLPLLRYSRSLWLHFNVRHSAEEELKQKQLSLESKKEVKENNWKHSHK